ncbi:SUMF1/EgtB/PvdO family nonheme iron enzyme [Runella sp. CRIBMP]|uniref:formylglycine-generating enzyme family protein n=1 Tax=Runella sp. CRIBMP TaxID=2683261 RepID=UPI001412107A|nr:formylglycine-generating enzyme family protein [Runella sp. CRIBMP]NBB19519.1 SUMF1/EgtB/PvdO family nonheme iron enzyme [Runella sp. CRIBMP]
MIRLLFVFGCILFSIAAVAQKVTFDDYKKRADACFKKQDYQCAKENYERALRIRNEEPYCKGQLQKSIKALAQKTNASVTPNPTSFPRNNTNSNPAPEKNVSRAELPDFVLVKGGTFSMGDDKGAIDERPVHSVTLADFFVAKHEVTVAQYRTFAKTTGKVMPAPPNWGWQDEHPIVGVSWDDAVAYCEWLSGQLKKRVRLLTEAEWEYAACGGVAKNTVSTEELGWYAGNTDGAGTKPVNTKKANKLGLFDMGGNAAEWCADWYDKNYYANSPSTAPAGPPQGSGRVVRGRSFGDEPKPLTFRYGLAPASKKNTVGFRVCYE